MSTAIVLFALVSLFIGLRLYSVLGNRSGHEQQPAPRSADKEVEDARGMAKQVAAPAGASALPADEDMAYLPVAGPGVRAILAADPSFDVGRFLEGARGAYRLILEKYWAGDTAAIARFVDRDIHDSFAEATAQREAAGLRLDNRLVGIDQSVISAAQLRGKEALVTVRFEALIAAVTRDAEGTIVAGSASDAVQTRDLWTFRRTLRSDDPNWLLVETDEEE